MIGTILNALIFILASPELAVQTNNQAAQVNLIVQGEDPLVDQCLDNAQEIRYRFEAQLCTDNSWLSDCSKQLVETHFLSWNPINNSYQLVRDRHRDQDLPNGITFESRSDAVAKLAHLEKLELDFITPDYQKYPWLRARVFSECRGEYNKTVAELSYYLTLGQIRLSGFNTGWHYYSLEKE